MKIQRAWWLPAATLLLALLLMQMPLQRQISQAVDDGLLRSVARDSNFDRVLVVDFDDASLRTLRPQLGAWPLSRDAHARLLETLRAAGAASVIFDIVFAEARAGDEPFAAALARDRDVVLAAAARQEAGFDEVQPSAAIEPFSTVPVPGTPFTAWAAVMLPTPQLLATLTHPGALGVISTSLDADGHLRRLPLLHDVGGRILPHLALAALLVEYDVSMPAATRAPNPVLAVGPHRWPLDAQGAVHLVLAGNVAAVPTLPASALLAATPVTVDAALRSRIEGRHVFVGSSAFFGDVVSTPQGRLHGTAMVAGAYEALRRGAVLAPASPLLASAMLLLALSPVIWVAWRGRPLLLQDAVASVALALLIGVAAWAAARWGGLQVSPWAALSTLMIGFALTMWLQVRSASRSNRLLRERQQAADAANQAKSEFLAGVSHELRTPLHAVLGMAEVLSQTPLAPDQRRYVEIFRSAGQTLVGLIDDLLDLSRAEAGQLALDPRPFVLVDLLEEVLVLLRPRAEAKGLRLNIGIAPDSPQPVGEVILGDAGRLRQVLVNLVANAVKFTATGSVSVVMDRDVDGLLRGRVSDTGIGIAATEQARIFQPFVQADGSITRRFGGTGLGLSISNDLVRMMGGSIGVHSEPGYGSTFHFKVPLMATDVAPVSVPPTHPDPPVVAPPAPSSQVMPSGDAAHGVSILLAEDNEVNVLVLEAMLAGTGHRVQVAPDGVSAVACFAGGRFGLVLMDVQMPGMDGHAATRAIRAIEAAERRQRTPVVALTANAFETERQASLAAGCDGHLVKPLERRALLDAIARHTASQPLQP